LIGFRNSGLQRITPRIVKRTVHSGHNSNAPKEHIAEGKEIFEGGIATSIEQSMQQPEDAYKGHSTRMRFSGILLAERTGFPAPTER
jgi:hypothetical protein